MSGAKHIGNMLLLLAFWTLLMPVTGTAVPRLRRTRSTSNSKPCSSKTSYVRGITNSLENGLQCEGRPKPYWGQVTQCSWRALERMEDYYWNECPVGYFLQNVDFDSYEFLCCKPVKHPPHYEDRITTEVKDNGGATLCDEGYFVCGTWDKKCEKICTRRVMFCKMFDPLATPKSIDDVKHRIQDEMQVPLSYLADFLGYGWCAGCRGRLVGENFVRTEQGWVAEKLGTCEGYKADHRLGITYSNWTFKEKGVREWGEELITDEPQVDRMLSGRIENNGTTTQKSSVGDEISRRHTIKHYKLSSFTFAHDAEFTLSYETKIFGNGVRTGTRYNFHYEDTEEEVRETESETVHTLTYGADITVSPCTAIDYKIIILSSKATTYYETSFQPMFFVQLNGFLRWGGGYNGDSTNYHQSHRGSSDRPTVSHSFGNSKMSFYEDLKEQVDKRQQPWQWSNMISKYNPLATRVIDMLKDGGKHLFSVKSKIEEIAYTRADIQFQEMPLPGCNASGDKTKVEEVENNNNLAHNQSKRSVRETHEDRLNMTTSSPDDDYWNNAENFMDSEYDEELESTKSPGDADPAGWSGNDESRPKVWTKSLDLRTGIWSDLDGLPRFPVNGKPKLDLTKEDKKGVMYFVDDQYIMNQEYEIQFRELPEAWASHGMVLISLSYYYIPVAVTVTGLNMFFTMV